MESYNWKSDEILILSEYWAVLHQIFIRMAKTKILWCGVENDDIDFITELLDCEPAGGKAKTKECSEGEIITAKEELQW